MSSNTIDSTHPIQPELHFPRYQELPDMGLYLDQVLHITNNILGCFTSDRITSAMINNWIKNKALPSPIKKKYTREHLCYLIVIGTLKQVFTVQQIARFFEIQRETYSTSIAYDFFCAEFENAVAEAFAFTGKPLPSIETKRTDQTVLIRSMVLAAANRLYAEKVLEEHAKKDFI